MIQDTINHSLVKYAKQGKVVTRLKGGNLFVFGRGAEEAQVFARNQGIPFEVVPGITSAGIAAPAYAGIPVTHRDFRSSFAIVTGHMRAGKRRFDSLGKSCEGNRYIGDLHGCRKSAVYL